MDEVGHPDPLLGAHGSLEGCSSHHPVADRRVADEGGHVRPDSAPLERAQVPVEVLPGPRDAGSQRLERHSLDEEEEAHQDVAIRLTAGSDREPAVPHHDRRDAVPGRRARGGIPEELAVVVRVDVDEARREDETCGVQLDVAALRHATDRRDAVAAHREVPARRLAAAAVAEERAPEHQVGHGWPS